MAAVDFVDECSTDALDAVATRFVEAFARVGISGDFAGGEGAEGDAGGADGERFAVGEQERVASMDSMGPAGEERQEAGGFVAVAWFSEDGVIEDHGGVGGDHERGGVGGDAGGCRSGFRLGETEHHVVRTFVAVGGFIDVGDDDRERRRQTTEQLRTARGGGGQNDGGARGHGVSLSGGSATSGRLTAVARSDPGGIMAGEGSKRAAARAAADWVESGMTLGLGTGSTATELVLELGERLRSGALTRLRAVPTSQATAALARAEGIALIDLPAGGVDLAIDGMDEVDARLDALKGLGGAATREKIVAASARVFVLIGDESKVVERLARRTPVPVEVLGFGLERTRARLRDLGATPAMRGGATPFTTDDGNPILDCALAEGIDPVGFAAAVEQVPGVVGHGLFLRMAARAFIAGPHGVRTL